MIRLSRNTIKQELSTVVETVNNYGFKKQLMEDATRGDGLTAMAYLVKRKYIHFPDKALIGELNNMVEKSLITIGQYDNKKGLIENSQTGNERVVNFLKKKRRITVV